MTIEEVIEKGMTISPSRIEAIGLNTYRNTFHKTRARSRLTEQQIEDTLYMHAQGYIGSSDKNYRSVMRLYNALCPHSMNGCSCVAAVRLD